MVVSFSIVFCIFQGRRLRSRAGDNGLGGARDPVKSPVPIASLSGGVGGGGMETPVLDQKLRSKKAVIVIFSGVDV
jgi:hypothetical protein